MITHADRSYLMKHLPILEDMSPERRLQWMQCTVAVHYAEGALLQCGDGGIGLILIKGGSLRIYLLSQEGREITLYNLQAGDFCVISTKLALQVITFEVHIEAEADCDALLMDADSFAAFCQTDAALESHFGRLLLLRSFSCIKVLERALSLSLDQRLAIFLTDGISQIEGNDIELTHDQIARHIGSTREVVTRALNHFATSGMVKLTRGNVEVLDTEKLDELNL